MAYKEDFPDFPTNIPKIIIVQFLLHVCQKSVMKRPMTLFNVLYRIKINGAYIWNGGPLKIRLLQCYEELWIHNINAICITIFSNFLNSFPSRNLVKTKSNGLENQKIVHEFFPRHFAI